jgi:hypothetical protein
VKPGRRRRQRYDLVIVAGLQRLRFVRGDPDQDRRRRRVAASGGVSVNFVIKSGTNQLKGTALLRRQQPLRADNAPKN